MPLLWISLAFLAGIILAGRIHLPVVIWLALAGFSLFLWFLLREIRSRINHSIEPDHFITRLSNTQLTFIPVPTFILFLFFFLGAARFQSAQPDLTDSSFIAAFNDLDIPVAVEAVLIRPPDRHDQYVELKARVIGIQLAEGHATRQAEGVILARDFDQGNWQYGDRLLLKGKLETPPIFEGFSYKSYLARQGVYSMMSRARVERIASGEGSPVLSWIYTYKDHALRTAYRLWSDPEASLLAGILLGDENGIPDDLYDAFRDTGTAHIIVISGFNITLLAGMLVGLFSRILGRGQFGIRRSAIFTLMGIMAYTLLVGADAAVVRAAIMGSLGLFAALVGRRQVGLNTLAIVAGLMALFNPNILGDVSFQLSFAATLGLVLYATPLQESFVNFVSRAIPRDWALKISRPVGEYFLFTLAAQMLVLPIGLYYFQRLSLIALVANPLVLPAQPPVMILGGAALLLGTIYFPLGQLFAWLSWPFAAYTIRLVEFLAGFPGSVIEMGSFSAVLLILFFGCLFALTFFGERIRAAAQAIPRGLLLMGMIVTTVLVWRIAWAAPDGRLHLTVLNVGMGDGLLIQTPGGRHLLIDGGPSAMSLSQQLGRRLPPMRRGLDWLVVAASGESQIDSLARNLERFSPDRVLWAGPTQGTQAARTLQVALNKRGLVPAPAVPGQALDLGEGAQLRVIAVSPKGAILMLCWRDFNALLPIGLDFDTLEALQADPGLRSVTALLLAENGLASVNPPEWIAKLSPQVVLLSVGAGNREDLPSAETLEAVRGYTLLRTDQNGWIHLSTDGKLMWVEVEKK